MYISMNKERILYEDKDIIVCHKPAGIATQTARVGQADMVSEITNYLLRPEHGRGKGRLREDGRQQSEGGRQQDNTLQAIPYVGVVHRLDQPVEGILVFAANKQAAAELSRQIAENRMEKYYYAVICGQERTDDGRLEDYLVKDNRTNISRIVPPEVKGAKKAVLEYEILTPKAEIALAKIRLYTGRHHQIRVQMSHAGMSLLGDYKYADAQTVRISEQMHVKEVALCACQLSFQHPRTGKRMDFKIRPEGKIFQTEEFAPYYL